MKYKRFGFSKLVRDKIVDGIISVGNKPKYKILNREEYIRELKAKLLEESEELPIKDRKEVVKELADIQEIVDSLLLVFGITKKNLKLAQKRKNEKAGSFKKRLYVDYVDAIPGTKWIGYYLEQPDKYPEIKKIK